MKIKFNNPADVGQHGRRFPGPWWWWPAAALSLVASCAGAVPEPTEAHAARVAGAYPGVSRSSLSHGRRLFIDRCSSCHALPSPDSLPASSWPGEVSAMAKLARLGPDEQRAIEAYLVSVSPAPSPP